MYFVFVLEIHSFIYSFWRLI